MDFLKHLYSYFVPDNPDSKDSHATRMKDSDIYPGPVKSLIPVYNSKETASLGHAGLLHRAWDIQFTGISERIIDVDVAKECLYILEEEMFEVSTRAGKAGFYQWGLDAGHHQDGWAVYANLPSQFNWTDYKGNDEDLEPGPDFIDYVSQIDSDVNREVTKKPRPQPQPRFKKALIIQEPDMK